MGAAVQMIKCVTFCVMVGLAINVLVPLANHGIGNRIFLSNVPLPVDSYIKIIYAERIATPFRMSEAHLGL